MNGKTPHIVQYQGSKRKLAPQILQFMPERFSRLIEPFSGMAAISIAAAEEMRAESFIINDINSPLVDILQQAVESPDELAERYRAIWDEQFSFQGGHIEHYYSVRDCFNSGNQRAEVLLYLIARCVKGSVRYGSNGNFNQSPDKRRHGTNPDTLKKNLISISKLLREKTSFFSLDYRDILEMAVPGDLVYMDPPYQGVSCVRDNRYLQGISYEEFVRSIETLDKKGIDYIISYDGSCGEKEYGKDLPDTIGCRKILLNAGVSAQETLLGRKATTFEALYVSSSLFDMVDNIPKQLTFVEYAFV